MTTKLKYLRFFFDAIWDGNYIDFYKKPIAQDLGSKSLHYKISTKNYYNDTTEILNKDNIRYINGNYSKVEDVYTNHIAPVRSIPYLLAITITGDWILATNSWNDNGVWRDDQTWKD